MSPFFVYYLQYSHVVIFAFCFSLFEKMHKQKISIIFQFILLLIVGVLVGHTYSTLDLLILFLLVFTFSYRKFPQENPMQIIFSIMCSATIEIITSRLYVEAYSQALKVEDRNTANLVLIMAIILSFIFCIIAVTTLKNKLYLYLQRENKLNSVAFLMMVSVLSYQTIKMIQNYAENQNLFFLLLIFYLMLSGLIVLIVRALAKNAALETKAKNDKVIAELQKQYVDEVKKQYQETRKFRHDYTNLLSTINYYLESNKIPELKEYFATDIMKTNAVLKDSDVILDSLQNIESLGVRSIFYTKLLLAQEKNIDVQIEIRELLPEKKIVDTISLVRLFGIFLDNAIEELESIQEGVLTIVAFKENADSVFIIQNTTRDKIEALQLLKKEGFSTRGEERGLGLANVEEILLTEPHILLETKIIDKLFIQRITILSEVE